MKRKLQGLLSIWLAVMMILSSVAVFAEEGTTGTIYVYQKTLPLKDGDCYDKNGDITPYINDGTFACVDNFDLYAPITSQLEESEKLPTAPDGYELDGWLLWARDSGMAEPPVEAYKNADGQEYIGDHYEYEYNILEPTWNIKYKFTKNKNKKILMQMSSYFNQ